MYIYQHINSQEVFDLTEPVYTKVNSVYGYLVLTATNSIYFIDLMGNCDNVTISYVKCD